MLLLLLLLLVPHATPHDANPRIHDWLVNAVKQSLAQVQANSCGSEKKHPCSGRDLSNAAVSTYLVSSLENNGTINTTGSMHFLSQVQPDASFVGQGFCALAQEKEFMSSLNATSRNWVIQSINKALPMLSTWESIDVSYSNMYFMGMVNAIICGEAPGVDPTLGAASASHGYALLNRWLEYAAVAGNHEFDSPTYYWVQFNALGLGCMYSLNATRRAQLCGVLEHLWADVASNWFASTETLSGAHSRDYDFLYGHGALQVLTYINGLGQHAPVCEFHDAHCERTNDGQNALVLLNALRARDGSGKGHQPSAGTLSLSNISVRLVQSRWLGQNLTANNMTGRFGDRYNYIKSGVYAMGSASQDYITNTHFPFAPYYPCPQDKLINIDLAVNMTQYRPAPSVTLVHDWLDHPWGHNWGSNPTNKPSHLAPHPGNVQHKNILLSTSALNPTEMLDGFNITHFQNLATNVILPASPHSTFYYVNGDDNVTAPPDDVYRRKLDLLSTIGVRVGSSCLAVRVLAGDGLEGFIPSLEIKADQIGLGLGAFRLALYHYVGKANQLSSSSHVANAFLMVVQECSSDGSGGRGARLMELVKEIAGVVINQHRDENVWLLSAVVRGTTLEVVRDVSVPHCSSWECVMTRRVNGTDVVPVPLTLNGQIVVPLPTPL